MRRQTLTLSAAMRNTSYECVHNIAVVVHSARNPRPEEWDGGLAMLAALRSAAGAHFSGFKILVFTDGGAPNAMQRKALADLTRAQNREVLRVVVISRSMVARGAITALRWLGFPSRPFAPDQLEEAFAFLQVSRAEARDICLVVEKLCTIVGDSIRSASRVESYRNKLSA